VVVTHIHKARDEEKNKNVSSFHVQIVMDIFSYSSMPMSRPVMAADIPLSPLFLDPWVDHIFLPSKIDIYRA
jgi:hypothetical protein